jgi:PD-(D/E)XK nuclease superfamily protein
LETVYEVVLANELRKIGVTVERQKAIPITLPPVHAKQVLTQLRLTNLRLGYLINFGEEHLKHGIKRLANRLAEQ